MEISLSELSEVKGIGKKTIQRIREYKLAEEGYISRYDENLHLDINSINQGDCLELMNGIPDKSVDMILADLPYGTTACSWDSIIDLDKLWLQYKRVIKDNGAIVLTATNPFSTKLVSSNMEGFKYEWIWRKEKGVGFQCARFRPMQEHEHILVFSKSGGRINYYPQMVPRDKPYTRKGVEGDIKKNNNGSCPFSNEKIEDRTYTHYYPKSIKQFNRDIGLHPTQKPVALFEYLIKTYTNEGNTVLDNTAGSGTTGVACQNTNRNYILIEQEQKYIDVINERLK
jgi:site-specific DNA-methyltransferase (adenine-specific)